MEHISRAFSLLQTACTSCYGYSALVLFAIVGAVSVGSLVVPWLWSFLTTFRSQDLKKKYNASWALVTGGSSGIGESLCHQLAAQGLNIVMAAVPDATLDKAYDKLTAAFPGIQVRKVGVDLAAADASKYMVPLEEATRDIPVQIVFNNAGYIVTSFFEKSPLNRWLANYHCNSTAPVVITHHFVTRMRAANLRGCIVFTSSPANIMPTPFSTIYGSTKAAITHFATSLACEVAGFGIDVSVCHPSPVATSFYTGAVAMPTLQLFKSTATGPDRVADTMIRGVGRSLIIDQGYYPFVFRLLLRVIDFTTLAGIIVPLGPGTADYKELAAKQADLPIATTTWAPAPQAAPKVEAAAAPGGDVAAPAPQPADAPQTGAALRKRAASPRRRSQA